MNPDFPALENVLCAAENLLNARESEMLTTDEWDALEHAVAACNEVPADQRDESFAVEDGSLVRRVVPRRGSPYEHRCEQDSYETVAHAIDELSDEPFVLDDLRARTGVPWTQVAVALALMKERGCVVPTHGRKHRAASRCVFEDAMVEFHALREKGPE